VTGNEVGLVVVIVIAAAWLVAWFRLQQKG
jgi:hypothetical protein